jgi:hypothetical protein
VFCEGGSVSIQNSRRPPAAMARVDVRVRVTIRGKRFKVKVQG